MGKTMANFPPFKDGRTPVRILEPANNRRGDLLGRLMSYQFIAPGYAALRLAIQKPGREVDLVANHRIESRRAIAEGKPTKRPAAVADRTMFGGGPASYHDDDRHVL